MAKALDGYVFVISTLRCNRFQLSPLFLQHQGTFLKLINNSSSQTKKITTVKEVWIPGLNKHRFGRFFFSIHTFAFVSIEKIYQTLRQCFISHPNPSNFVEKNSAARRIFNSSQCLDIPMKLCLSCFISLKNPGSAPLTLFCRPVDDDLLRSEQ